MAYINLKFSFGKGKFYESSKTPKEGFEEVIYGINKDQKTYHKDYTSATGTLKAVNIRDVEFSGVKTKLLQVTLGSGEDLIQIACPIYGKYGVDEFAKAMVSALYNAEFGEEVVITPKKTVSNVGDKTYNNINVYVNYLNRKDENGRGLSTGFIAHTEIPKAVKNVTKLGKTTYDNTAVDEFWEDRLTEILDKSNAQQGSTQTSHSTAETPKTEAPKQAPPTNTEYQYEEDDLPF